MAKISTTAFLMMWNDYLGRDTPDCHIRIADWLDKPATVKVLLCHRGIGKSSTLAPYNACRFYNDSTYQILHQSESDPSARKISRATQSILRRHPLTKEMIPQGKMDVERWNVNDINSLADPLHSSMLAKGIMSNVTGSRADEVQNDDVEVPRNITSQELREKLRERLDEQTHILKPGGKKLYVGTPHTYDSIYTELIAKGADVLVIKLFSKEKRFNKVEAGKPYYVGFAPQVVFIGIHKSSEILEEGVHYHIQNNHIVFASAYNGILDCYADVSWPERFTPQDILTRRRETRTINAWDSQYQLHAKPINESRLDPERIRVYDVEPTIIDANGEVTMMLGNTRIVGASAVWDPSAGKIKSDASAFTLLLTDNKGHLYWHVCTGLTGEIAVFGENSSIVGGQVIQLCDFIEKYNIPSIIIETNGIGGFAPTLLRQALKSRGLRCGVIEKHEIRNKQIRILEAIEAPLESRFLWAHISIADEDKSPVFEQMRNFNPEVSEQPDDYIDSLAGAIHNTPIRIAKSVQKRTYNSNTMGVWRPGIGQTKAKIKY